MSDVPVLTTDRLILRGHRAEDHAAACAMWGDPSVTQYIGGTPLGSEDVWSRMLRYAGLWSLVGHGFWVIEERATGAFLGEAGFLDMKRAIEPDFGDAIELGWGLVPQARGRGIATEAVRAALAWGDARWGGARPVGCIIDPDNLASLRLAERCGFGAPAIAQYKGHAVTMLRRQPPNNGP